MPEAMSISSGMPLIVSGSLKKKPQTSGASACGLAGLERRIGAGELGDAVGILGEGCRPSSGAGSCRRGSSRLAGEVKVCGAASYRAWTRRIRATSRRRQRVRSGRRSASTWAGSLTVWSMPSAEARATRPIDRGMAAHRRQGEVGAVGNAPQVDLARAERVAQILEIVGILLGRVAGHRDAGGAPFGEAAAERLAIIGGERRLGQRHGRDRAAPRRCRAGYGWKGRCRAGRARSRRRPRAAPGRSAGAGRARWRRPSRPGRRPDRRSARRDWRWSTGSG